MYTYCSFETFEKDNVKYYLQFGVGSRHGNRFREELINNNRAEITPDKIVYEWVPIQGVCSVLNVWILYT